ncbi:hypothetical protein, conserved [Eimeria praecox]|uniref:Uncharacterized protein n=1 Tax=Eimeria praecox TaxID=51316 RepID=U6G3V2_9EIME|nr:hypothetical protein, conserved [Eimeria praecox]
MLAQVKGQSHFRDLTPACHPFLTTPGASALDVLWRGKEGELANTTHAGSFAWAKESSPCGYARLCRAGFLPIAERFMHSDGSGCRYWLDVSGAMAKTGCGSPCGRALHRRTLRDAALRRKREDSAEGSSNEVHGPNHTDPQQTVQQTDRGCHCPEDVQLHSFEVWVPLCEIANIKLIPLKTSTEETGTSVETTPGSGADATALSTALTSLGSSPRIGEASTQFKDLCLVAGELGVSVGRVYTSLTAFTDADSAGTAQLTATRLLLRKAGQ